MNIFFRSLICLSLGLISRVGYAPARSPVIAPFIDSVIFLFRYRLEMAAIEYLGDLGELVSI